MNGRHQGLPLRGRDARREFWASLGGAIVWLAVALGGYLVIRFSFNLAMGGSAYAVPKWLPYVVAGFGAAAATALHLLLAWRSRRTELVASGKLRLWLVAVLGVVAVVLRPDLLGMTAMRAYYELRRSAPWALHLQPAPLPAMTGYKADRCCIG